MVFPYDKWHPVNKESIYDMASVTKICATTISVMKLYDEENWILKKKLGDTCPVKGTNKQNLEIEDILLHQAGLVAYFLFSGRTMHSGGIPYLSLFIQPR